MRCLLKKDGGSASPARPAQPPRTDRERCPYARNHEELWLNWFRAKSELSSGAIEGLNGKIRVVIRRSFGFLTFKAMEKVIYHALGRLPEPETAHGLG